MVDYVYKIFFIFYLCSDYIVVDKLFDTFINSEDFYMVFVEILLSKYYLYFRDFSVKYGFRLDVVLVFKIFFFVFYGNLFFF